MYSACEVKSLTAYLEGGKIPQCNSVNSTATKNIYDIVNESRGVAFSRRGNVSYTLQFTPLSGVCVKRPGIVVMVLAVCTTKPETRLTSGKRRSDGYSHENLVTVCDHSMPRSPGRALSVACRLDKLPLRYALH